MKNRLSALVLGGLLVAAGPLTAGPYNQAGISNTSPLILGWATGVTNLTRGPVDISVPNGAKATYGDASSALGPAVANADDPYPVVSLGDGGSITLSFSLPIANGPGADFAVFENGFLSGSAYYLELGFVEVSSNGTDFLRFPSISLTQSTTQVGSFGTLDPTNIYNLAGKHVGGTGTPFDLQDLVGLESIAIDLNNIRYVRIIDVVGSIDPAYARYDSRGRIINDPWRTDFTTGGFDLDGVAVLNTVPEPSVFFLLGVGCLLLVGRRVWLRRV